jgi:hypothetical protein
MAVAEPSPPTTAIQLAGFCVSVHALAVILVVLELSLILRSVSREQDSFPVLFTVY